MSLGDHTAFVEDLPDVTYVIRDSLELSPELPKYGNKPPTTHLIPTTPHHSPKSNTAGRRVCLLHAYIYEQDRTARTTVCGNVRIQKATTNGPHINRYSSARRCSIQYQTIATCDIHSSFTLRYSNVSLCLGGTRFCVLQQ